MAAEEDVWIGVADKEKNLSTGPREDAKMWGYCCFK
eukprot:CAMPEP_0168316714 /NCGR_PEP_ID=MMETSP0210-20121227/18486_1 /TAXON_ID=40633 /ORGANISM="Condylostoma magnum, Strain COL2" /LENGTH=35 /DNA_ID= /DNA_START= /DNA_END= /DNA_ORIENTATION=